jgi:hypothetical protein
VCPGKAQRTVPTVLRDPEKIPEHCATHAGAEGDQADRPGLEEILFSDRVDIKRADQTQGRGCFALWTQTRHILAIACASHLRAELVVTTTHVMDEAIPMALCHSDQGSQCGAEVTHVALLTQGFVRSMRRAGTPTDHGFAERCVGPCTLSVAERRR